MTFLNLHYYIHFTLLLTLTIFTTPSSLQPPPIWIKPYIIDYLNGTIIRDTVSDPPTFVLPPNDPHGHIQSKDITLTSSPHNRTLKARVFLPARPDPNKKIPILIYFHGGAFCIGSAFSQKDTLFLARLTARSNIIAFAIEYRLYPDSIMPDPYRDAWAALKWVLAQNPNGSIARSGPGPDPWLARYGDFERVYTGGDSAGGNIAHNLAIRAGLDRVKLTGVILAMPYFLGSGRVPLEPESIKESPNYKIWAYVCPKCKGGVDNGYINPIGPNGPKLSGLGCEKLLVYTAEMDELRGRGRAYYEEVMKSGWNGKGKLIEAQGKNHVFHILQPQDPATTTLIEDFSTFINAL